MADVIDKKAALRRYWPSPFYNLQDGKGLAIILDAVGEQLNTAAEEVANARAQFLLATAEGPYLQVHGVNVDILRPRGFNMTDARFRQLIEIITNSPKNIEQIFERLIALFFGPTAIQTGLLDVYSYRKNEIIVEVDHNALIVASSRSLLGTTYLHRSHLNAYTGAPQASWSTTLASAAGAGDTQVTITSAAGVPLDGVFELGGTPLIKTFVRTGAVLAFDAPLGTAFPSGSPIAGPQTPDNYPSGYVYYREQAVDLVQSVLAGSTQVNIGALPENFPDAGTVYLGDPLGSTFEAKGYTLTTAPNRLHFQGPLAFAHSSGETAVPPTMTRMIRTTLAQTITAGSSLAELSVGSSADFPLVRQAIRLDNGGNVPENVPFISRKVGDNTKVLIDPAYVFRFSHAPGERVHLMARMTAPRVSGYDYPFFLNDTDGLRNTFFNILRRVKVTGVKIVFVIK